MYVCEQMKKNRVPPNICIDGTRQICEFYKYMWNWTIMDYAISIQRKFIKTLPLLLSGNNRQIDRLCFYNVWMWYAF